MDFKYPLSYKQGTLALTSGQGQTVSEIISWLETIQGERFINRQFGLDYRLFFSSGTPTAVVTEIKEAHPELSQPGSKVEVTGIKGAKMEVSVTIGGSQGAIAQIFDPR